MKNLSEKFEQISGVHIRPQDFAINGDDLVISPYGEAGITFQKDGTWRINDSDTFSIRFLRDRSYEELDTFGEYLKAIDFRKLIAPDQIETDPYDEAIELWRSLKEELDIAATFLAEYNSGLIAPSSYTINIFSNAFFQLAKKFLNMGPDTASDNNNDGNTSERSQSDCVTAVPAATEDDNEDMPF